MSVVGISHALDFTAVQAPKTLSTTFTFLVIETKYNSCSLTGLIDTLSANDNPVILTA